MRSLLARSRSPNYGPRRNFVIDEKIAHLRKFIDLVEYNIPRNNHITYDVRPSTCSVLPYLALGQKSLGTLGLSGRKCLILGE